MVRFSSIIIMIGSLLCLFGCGSEPSTLFKRIESSASGITFNNTIIETDTINILDYENVYNGGGVGVADFNQDGLPDLYFTGNLVPNKLYLNKGKFKFEDITAKSGTAGEGRWSRGVSVIDINNDGKQDIYVSASAKRSPNERQNLLYINQGNDAAGIPLFREMAAAYGLNDTTYSTMANFFDYDNDGDLDMYLCVNDIVSGDFPNRFRPRLTNGEHPSTGRLYRNDWNAAASHPVFTDVSRQANVLTEGYGHAVIVTDINLDGWKDLYITNDYLSQNILYINNGDGTFTDSVKHYFKHTSANAMGCDVIDINNDGLSDVVELDMNPEDNYRKKMMLNANSYQTYQNSDYFGYQYQYVRNTLQVNQGRRVNGKDSVGDPIFSEQAFYAGIAETDWSWAPIVADFDNDGYRDIVVTNGFPKDITDHDFVAFRNDAFAIAEKKQLLEQIPEVKIHNYAYRNKGNGTFADATNDWGFEVASFSNGGIYADLDNDGDLDVVINNINDEAHVYENTLKKKDDKAANFLRVHLEGDSMNKNGIGAWIAIHYAGKMQAYEQTPYRGYLSSIQNDPHFGLGEAGAVDSVVVKWPGGKKQVIVNVPANQLLTVRFGNANQLYDWKSELPVINALFTNITDGAVEYVQKERDFIDFNIQKLLPHKFSESGPAMAVADFDGNKLDDIVVGGSFGNGTILLLQRPDGSFVQKEVMPQSTDFTKPWEDAGIAVFDAEGDGDVDMYIASGGFENASGSAAYGDKFYINDGNANFRIDTTVIPRNYTSKSCVRAADYDHDGDLDLFVGGRVDPWNYPKPVNSFVYRNDSKDGRIIFTDVKVELFNKIGMVTDALWTDFNQDGWLDLVLAGEWMPLKFIQNDQGTFKDVTQSTGITDQLGWWRSIVPGDFDNDGDIDYVAGNLGLNSFYRASKEHPVKMYAKDFDNNGSYDAVPALYLPSTIDKNEYKEYPAQTRDDLIKQMIGFRSKFKTYASYATSTIDKMFTADEMKDAIVLSANNFSQCLIKNNGGGKFELVPLPAAAQVSCLNGMLAEDIDGDGNLDLVINGNDYGTEVSVGRYDACNGLFFKGDGKGGFTPLNMLSSGIFIPGNGKSLVKLRSANGRLLVAASQNRNPLYLFASKGNTKNIEAQDNEIAAVITLKDGRKQRAEINYGSSWLSQSGRFIVAPAAATSCEFIGAQGTTRTVQIN